METDNAGIVFACSQKRVSSEYYGGNYAAPDVNRTFIYPLEKIT